MQFRKLRRISILNWLVRISLLIIGLIIGLCVRDYPFIEFDPTVDTAEAVNILLSLLTLAVGLYIAISLDRTKKLEEYKFAFIFSKLKEMEIIVKDIGKTVSNNLCEISEINAKIKFFYLSFGDLKEAMQMCGFKMQTGDEKNIMKLHRHIRNLATESRKYKFDTNVILYQDEKELEIKEGIITYSELRIDEIRSYLNKLINALFNCTMKD